jgi:uncharacterized protein YbgA (DUF1722 family)/uncharacterized protein YbbK (DUF523 family)
MYVQHDNPSSGEERVAVGISSCLLGEAVRFDGGHKRNSYITETLSRYFDFVPVCPEVGIGLGTPRKALRLVGCAEQPRAMVNGSPHSDVTDALTEYGARMATDLAHLRGYIFKKASPSCGMERVRVYDRNNVPKKAAIGIYAHALMRALPLLPVEEEGRLTDPLLREQFIERVYVYHRWLSMISDGLTPRKLVEFHSAHKLLVMAHSQEHYRRLGQLVARAGRDDLTALAQCYVSELMQALKQRGTRKRHANVLHHLSGYFKRHLTGSDKLELNALIDAYRLGQIPLVVPITLIRHYLRRFPNAYVGLQYYLRPHPEPLGLRNSV